MRMCDLPGELVGHVLAQLPSASDVGRCGRASQRLAALASAELHRRMGARGLAIPSHVPQGIPTLSALLGRKLLVQERLDIDLPADDDEEEVCAICLVPESAKSRTLRENYGVVHADATHYQLSVPQWCRPCPNRHLMHAACLERWRQSVAQRHGVGARVDCPECRGQIW